MPAKNTPAGFPGSLRGRGASVIDAVSLWPWSEVDARHHAERDKGREQGRAAVAEKRQRDADDGVDEVGVLAAGIIPRLFRQAAGRIAAYS